MISEAIEFLQSSNSLKSVGFILFDQAGYQAFADVLNQIE
jgi:hypothetical protein